MKLHAAPPDRRAFAPFGDFIAMPDETGGRRLYSDWLTPVPGLTPQLYTNRVAPTAMPLTLVLVERHPHTAQLFLPLSASRYLVTVMPSDDAGRPQPGLARSFVVPRTLGVAYRPGVWHAAITAVDEEASFAVLMWRGAADDDVFAVVPPITVEVRGGGEHE
jgi:ureidoglycolate lyase